MEGGRINTGPFAALQRHHTGSRNLIISYSLTQCFFCHKHCSVNSYLSLRITKLIHKKIGIIYFSKEKNNKKFVSFFFFLQIFYKEARHLGDSFSDILRISISFVTVYMPLISYACYHVGFFVVVVAGFSLNIYRRSRK